MSFMASASRRIQLDPEQAFERFVDFRNWAAFMPDSFRPLRGPDRPLKPGDRLKLSLDTGALKLPVVIGVFCLDPPHEIVWGGGNALLFASHRFGFEPAEGGGVRICSDEEWTGLLANVGPVARRVKRQAEIVGRAQLEGFARYIERESSVAARAQ